MQIPTPKTCLAQSIHTHSTHTHMPICIYTHAYCCQRVIHSSAAIYLLPKWTSFALLYRTQGL